MEINQLIAINAILFIVWFVTTVKFLIMKDTYNDIIDLCAEKGMKIIELGEIIDFKSYMVESRESDLKQSYGLITQMEKKYFDLLYNRELGNNEMTNTKLYDMIDELKSQLMDKDKIIDEMGNTIESHKCELFNAGHDYKGR